MEGTIKNNVPYLIIITFQSGDVQCFEGKVMGARCGVTIFPNHKQIACLAKEGLKVILSVLRSM